MEDAPRIMTSEQDSGSLTREEQALQQAEAEGLTLMESTNKAGYFGVSHQPGRAKPYQAKVWSGKLSPRQSASVCDAYFPFAASCKGRSSKGECRERESGLREF